MGGKLSRAQDRHHREFWDSPRTGTLTYVALGDSAGVGIGVERIDDSYVGTIARRLEETTGHRVGVHNLSQSGARAQDVLEHQIPQLGEITAASFVTCAIGGNDIAWSGRFSEKNFFTAIDAIAAQLPKHSTLGLIPSFRHWPYENRTIAANRAICRAAANYAHEIADIYTPTRSLPLPKYVRTLARDYFHPNRAGHEIWANAFWESIQHRSP